MTSETGAGEALAGRWTQVPGIVARRVAGELVLVPVDVASIEPGSFFVLNEAGEQLWSLLAEPCEVDHMARHLIDQYGIDLDTARRDAIRFVERLVACEAIRAHEGL